MKESQYLTHDFGARNDPKLLRLQMDLRGEGIAVYWCLVEMLWEQGGYLPLDYGIIAFTLRWTSEEVVRRVVEDFDLFSVEEDRFFSPSALRRIQKTQKVRESRAAAGKKGGSAGRDAVDLDITDDGPETTNQANAKQMLSKCSDDAEQIGSTRKKEREQENKKDISIPRACARQGLASEAEKERFLEIFFFDRGFANPQGELARFIAHYDGNWCRTGSSVPVPNKETLAQSWKPEDGAPGFDKKFRAWYKGVYATAKTSGMENYLDLLTGLIGEHLSSSMLELKFRTKALAEAAQPYLTAIPNPPAPITIKYRES